MRGRLIERVLFAVALAVALTSCASAPEVTDEELKQMCQRLVVLRGEEPDVAKTKKCVAEARKEGVSQRQARCRIQAVNKQEYWNRCRTGAARAQ